MSVGVKTAEGVRPAAEMRRRLSDSAAVTSPTELALPASEKNAALPGTLAYMALQTEEMRNSVYNTPEGEFLDFNDVVPETVNKFRCFYLSGSGQIWKNSFTAGNFHGLMLAGARTSMNYLFQIFFDYYSGVHMRISSAGNWSEWKSF